MIAQIDDEFGGRCFAFHRNGIRKKRSGITEMTMMPLML